MRLDQRHRRGIVAQRDHARAAAPREGGPEQLHQHHRQQREARLDAVAEVIEPAERDEAALLALFLDSSLASSSACASFLAAFFLTGSSASSASSSSSVLRQPKPAASASAANAASPIMIAMMKRVAPESGPPKTQAGARNSASPITPPRPVGSGQALLGGRQDAKPAAAAAPMIHRIEARALAIERAMGEQPPAPGGEREQERDRRDAEQLHHQVGADRAAEPEHVAHRRIGGVAERGVLHRPGGERDRRDAGKPEQRRAR